VSDIAAIHIGDAGKKTSVITQCPGVRIAWTSPRRADATSWVCSIHDAQRVYAIDVKPFSKLV
jgi:hypothetical protein